MSDLDRVTKGISIQPQTTSPLVEAGDLYYDAITSLFYYFDGTNTIPLGNVTTSGGPTQPIGAVGSAGIDVAASKSDHVHEGVHSINAVVGDVNVAQGTGVSVVTAAPNITVNFLGAAAVEFDAGTLTTSPTLIDWSNGISQKIKVSHESVISFTGGAQGTVYTLRLYNDFLAHYLVSFDPTNILWKNGVYPGISQGPNEQTIFYFYLGADGVYLGSDEQTYSDTQFLGVKQVVLGSAAGSTGFPGRQVDAFMTFDNQKWYCWGFNLFGQLGLGAGGGGSVLVPNVSAFVIGRSFSKISPGDTHSVGLEVGTGNAYAWGQNTVGQLGNGGSLQVSPTSVLGGRSFSQIATGTNFTIALEASTGLAWAWGSGTQGQLGSNAAVNASSPVSVVGGRSWRRIAAGTDNAIAIEASTGRAYMWGSGNFNVLGNPVIANASSPISVTGGRSYIQCATRGYQSGAIEGSTGAIWQWGTNAGNPGVQLATAKSFSQLDFSQGLNSGVNYLVAIEANSGNLYGSWIIPRGNGTTFNLVSGAIQISPQSFSTISVGNEACAAIEASTGIANMFGMTTGYGGLFNNPIVGNGWNQSASVPVAVPPVMLAGQSFSKFAGRTAKTIGRSAGTGQLWAWGGNGFLGDNSSVGKSGPVLISAKSFSWITLGGTTPAGGINDTGVGIEASTGNAYIWGQSPIGDGTLTNRSAPVSVVGGRSFIKAVGASTQGARAIEGSTGNIYSWGSNGSGEIGDNTTITRSSPVVIAGGRSYKHLAAVFLGTCAIEGSTGLAYTWGDNANGVNGTNDFIVRSAPVSVFGGRSWSTVGGLQSQATLCAIEGSTGNAYCWGSSQNGALGIGVAGDRSSPVSVVGGRSFVQVSMGENHWLAIEGSTGHVYSWGLGSNFQLGDGTNISRSSLVLVSGGRSYIWVAAGTAHSMAVDGQGNNFFWGLNQNGEFGNSGCADFVSPISIGRVGKFP